MTLLNPSLIHSWVPGRAFDAHKGSCGRILIIAGSRGMMGAAVMVALGAVRAGAGLVKLLIVKSQQALATERLPLEVTTKGLAETAGHLSFSAWPQIKTSVKAFRPTLIAMGPGLGCSQSVKVIVRRLLEVGSMPLVLDADALNMFPVNYFKKVRPAPIIMTPHEAEWGRMVGRSACDVHRDRRRNLLHVKPNNTVVLLKGHKTLISDGRNLWTNTTGHPSMASAGMGDVLTGLVAGLWGQYPIHNLITAAQAACVGAYVHGLAGQRAYQRCGGLSVLATEVAAEIPLALKAIMNKRPQ